MISDKKYEKLWIYDPLGELFRYDRLFDIIPSHIPSGICLDTNTVNVITRFMVYYIVLSLIVKSNKSLKKDVPITIFLIFALAVISITMNKYYCNTTPSIDNPPPAVPIVYKNLNNPFGNPNPYTGCHGVEYNHSKSHTHSGIGQRNSSGILGQTQNHLSDDEIIRTFGDNTTLSNVTVENPTIQYLKNNQNTLLLRSFFKLPVTDCVNDQDKFAKSLFGDPSKRIWKQHNINNFE